MMKILYTESSPNMGGQEMQALTQMQAFREQGHAVVLACRKYSKISFNAERLGIPVCYIPFRNSLHLPSVYRLLQFMHRFSPDMVICHSGHDSNTVGIARLVLSVTRRPPRVIRQKTYLTGKIKPFSLNYLNDVLIVPGHDIRDRLVQAGCSSEKITVIAPGFNFKRMCREAEGPLPAHIRSWLKLSGDAPVIVQVGMLRPEKGHDFMLKVLAQLKVKGRAFRYLIVGSGSPEAERAIGAEITALKLWDRVYMTGSVYPVMPVYRQADLVVMPSRKETFGMVVVEASSLGVPVFASQVGGLPDIIRHGVSGILLPVDSPDEWRAAMCDFLDNPDCYRRLAVRARVDVEARFTIHRVVADIVALGKGLSG